MEGIFYCTGGAVVVSNFFSSVGGSFFNSVRRKIMSNFFFSCEWVVVVGSFFN